MKKFALIASLCASLAFSVSTHAAEFVVNGNFDQLSNGVGNLYFDGPKTSATAWSTTGYAVVFNNATTAMNSSVALSDANNGGANTWDGTAPGGVNFVALDGSSNYAAPITQMITGLKVGNVYTLSFEYAFAQQQNYTLSTQQNITASFGGNPVFTLPTYYNLPNAGFSGWFTQTLSVTATSSSEALSFLASASGDSSPPFALLTGVSLTGAVPEPATWGMMIVGLGAMGAAARLRRRQAFAIA